MEYFYNLNSSPQVVPAHLVGDKAYNLIQMNELLVPVPEGFVITTEAYEQFQRGLLELRELVQHFPSIKAQELIIRSSAVGEDGADHSFAGQLDSFTVQNNPADIEKGILKCWRSLENKRLQVYQDSSKKLMSMGVIVQKMIQPDHAGVYFTAAPDNADRSVVEYVQGHCEKLVQGEVTPETVYSGDEHSYPFAFDQLEKQAKTIKEFFKTEQDIEWVEKAGQIYFVQARPITTHRRKIQWSSTNLNENYPNQLSPLLYSIAKRSYYHYYKNLATKLGLRKLEPYESVFANAIGSFGERMYYNMSAIHQIIALSPFNKLLGKSFNNFVGYQKEALFDAGSAVWDIIHFSFYSVFHFGFLERHVRKIEKRVEAYGKEPIQVKKMSSLYHEFLDIRMNFWWHASLADYFSMLFHGLLGSYLKKVTGSKKDQNTLIQAIPGLVSHKPIEELWRLKKIKEKGNQLQLDRAQESYIENWGFRCSEELTFFKENYAENPELFQTMFEQYLHSNPTDPRISLNEKHKEQKKRLNKICKNLNLWQALVLRFLVRSTMKSIAARERVRLKQAQLYFKFKQLCLFIAEKLVARSILENKNDIFYLEYEEISRILSSEEVDSLYLKKLIALRKERLNSSKEQPENISNFEYDWSNRFIDEDRSRDADLRGLPACGGVVRAKAVVLDSVHEISQIKKGDILVTKQTDPGWICAFPLISGLVVERGGMLSHGAIVAREFGIPAVVGVKDITKKIKTGDEIEVDGDCGSITLR